MAATSLAYRRRPKTVSNKFLGYTIHNLQTCDGTDGQAFSLILCKDGIKLCEVRNSGRGGSNSYDFLLHPYAKWQPRQAQLQGDAEKFCKENEGWWTEFFDENGHMDHAEWEDWFVAEIPEVV